MKKVFVNKAQSFKEAEKFDREYYASMTPQDRLNIVQELREMYFKFFQKHQKGRLKNARRERLRRVIKIV